MDEPDKAADIDREYGGRILFSLVYDRVRLRISVYVSVCVWSCGRVSYSVTTHSLTLLGCVCMCVFCWIHVHVWCMRVCQCSGCNQDTDGLCVCVCACVRMCVVWSEFRNQTKNRKHPQNRKQPQQDVGSILCLFVCSFVCSFLPFWVVSDASCPIHSRCAACLSPHFCSLRSNSLSFNSLGINSHCR